MKRIFVMLLACLMLLSVVPFSVFAEEADHEHGATEQCPGKEADHTVDNTASYEELEKVQGSCGGYSYTVYQCNACDKIFADDFVKTANDSHKWEETPNTAKEPTCTEAGKEADKACANCGAVEIGKAIPAAHKLDENGACTECDYVANPDCEHKTEDLTNATLIEVPTCGTAGKMQYTCECGAIVVVVIEALGHDENNLVHSVEVKADCTNAGTKAYDTCRDCGKFFINGEEVTAEDLVIEALGHDMNEAIIVETPNCVTKEDGLKVATCKRCGKTEETPISWDSDEVHNWIDEEGTEAGATCTRPGITYKVCTICGANKDFKTTPALGHKIPKDWTHGFTEEEIANTPCNEKLTASYICETCGVEITVVVKAETAHTFTEKSVEATCSTYKKVWEECTVCGAIDNVDELEEEGFNADNHNWTEFWLNKPTCDEKGNWTWACSVHKDVFKDKILHEVPALHDQADNWEVVAEDAPTCDEEGSITYKCKTCGNTKTEPVKALGHTFDDGVYVHATCTDDAYTRYTCTVCGATKDEVEEDSHLGFDFTKTFNTLEEAQEAHGIGSKLTATTHFKGSCTEKGVMVYNCSSCGKNVLVFEAGTGEGHTRPEGKFNCTEAFKCEACGELVKGGTHEDVIDVEPTCDKAGKAHCAICGAYYYVYKHGFFHKAPVVVPPVKPTCTETGLTEGLNCGDCGEVIIAQDVVPATGHNYAIKNAAFSFVADCEIDGYNFMECACGARMITDYEFASGHWYIDEENDIKVELTTPDCNAECVCGQEVCVCRVCSLCGETIEKHTFAEPNVVDPTCTEEGYTITVCTSCGYYIIDEESIVEPLDHNFVAVEGSIPATYKDGYTNTKCSVCGEAGEPEVVAGADIGLTIEIENALEIAGNRFTDSSLVAVKINLNSIKEVGVWSINFNLNYNNAKFTYVETVFDTTAFNGFTKAVDNGTFVAIGATTANDENKQMTNTVVNAEDVAFVTVYFLVNDEIAGGEVEDVIANPFTVDTTFALDKDFEEVSVWGQTETEITIEKFMDYNKDGVVNAIDYKYAWEIINGTIDVTYDVTLDVDKDGQILENDFFAIFSNILGDAEYAYDVLVDRVVEAA